MSWLTQPLGEIADFVLGKMLDQAKNRGEPLPYLANINVRWGEFDLTNLREMRFEPHEIERYSLKSGDIVMCEGGEPGRCAVWKGQRESMMIQKALHRIRPHACLDNIFLYYTFLQIGRANAFAPFFTGATIKHLPREQLAKVPINFPNFPEQKAIASVLSAYDDLIATNQRRIALLEDAARRLYREWFVHLRFPGHESVPVKDRIPESWNIVPLSSLCEEVRDMVDPTTIYPDTAYLSMEHMPQKSISLGVWESAQKVSSTKHRFQVGDILFGKIRPYFHKVGLAAISGITSTDVIVVRVANLVVMPLVLMIMSSDNFVDHAVTTSNGTKMPRANWKILRQWSVPLPDDVILQQFESVVVPMLDQINALMIQNRSLSQTRDLLLPKLMSGQLDVSGIALPGEAAA